LSTPDLEDYGNKFFTDSTADLSVDLAREMDIIVVPLSVQFGKNTFLDGAGMDSDQFFQRLTRGTRLPTTSQPSPGAFMETYRSLLEAGHQVVSIHISSNLSGTMNSALAAKDEMGNIPVEVVDSCPATMGLGLVATAAASAVKDGASYEETIQVTRRTLGQVQLFGLLDTLEYLKNGGRIGMVKGF